MNDYYAINGSNTTQLYNTLLSGEETADSAHSDHCSEADFPSTQLTCGGCFRSPLTKFALNL